MSSGRKFQTTNSNNDCQDTKPSFQQKKEEHYDYDELASIEEVEKRQQLVCKRRKRERYDFYLSHASRGEKGVLPGEKIFVEELHRILEEELKLRVWVDFKEPISEIDRVMNQRLSQSRCVLFVRSPRFNTRYNEGFERITTEVDHFTKLQKNTKIPHTISVLFGLDRLSFESDPDSIPSLGSSYCIPTKFKDEKSLKGLKEENIDKEIAKEAAEVAKKIKKRYEELNVHFFDRLDGKTEA